MVGMTIILQTTSLGDLITILLLIILENGVLQKNLTITIIILNGIQTITILSIILLMKKIIAEVEVEEEVVEEVEAEEMMEVEEKTSIEIMIMISQKMIITIIII